MKTNKKSSSRLWVSIFLVLIIAAMIFAQKGTEHTFKAAIIEPTLSSKLTNEEKRDLVFYGVKFYDITFKTTAGVDTTQHARLQMNPRYIEGVDSVLVKLYSDSYQIIDVVK